MAGPDPSSQNPLDKYFVKVTRYHYFFFSLFLLSKFTTVWHTLNFVFISPPMNYTCADTNASSGEDMLNKCPCKNPIWDTSVFTKTVQTAFNVMCSEKFLVNISESGAMFGVLIGSLIFGLLSDKYGRLISFNLSNLLMGVTGCLIAILPNMILFIIVRILEGVGVGGVIGTGFVLCMEFCGPSYRPTMASIVQIPVNLGLVVMAGISYMIRDYRYFQLAISIPLLVCATMQFCVLDSPKWALDVDKQRALKLMKKFCRFNKNPCETLESDIAGYQGQQNLETKLKFHHIFKYRTHTKNFVCLAYGFFVCGMCYYGVSQFVGSMSTHVHVNTALNGLFTCIGSTCCIFIMSRVGRKPFLVITFILGGVCIIIVVALPASMKSSPLSVFFACLSCALFYITFIIVFLYAVELFPTPIRNSTFGMLAVLARVGQIFGPLINALSMTAAGAVFGVTAIIAGAVTLLLPETRGIELPTTLDDTPASTPVTLNRARLSAMVLDTKNHKGTGSNP